MRPGCTGFQPSNSWVAVLEARASTPKKRPSQPKCSNASAAGIDTTGRSRPRPMASAMAQVGTPSSAAACTDKPAVAGTDEPAVAGTDEPAVAGTDEPAVAGTDEPAVAGTDEPAVAGTDEPAVTASR